jgi:hypothetical protein
MQTGKDFKIVAVYRLALRDAYLLISPLLELHNQVDTFSVSVSFCMFFTILFSNQLNHLSAKYTA